MPARPCRPFVLTAGLLGERPLDKAAHLALILDDQNLHGGDPATVAASPSLCIVRTNRASPTMSPSGKYS